MIALSARAAEYFVAPGGSDTAGGSIDAPFATIQRAQASAEPGDTVWIRGGAYTMTEAQIARTVRP
ncbi:MAG TPA: pectate lyase, partial [Opitutaceae bacterium]